MSRSNGGGFFACFRPAVVDWDDPLARSRSSPVKGGSGERGPTVYVDFDDSKRAKAGARQRFAFGMSLVKKVRKKRDSKATEESNKDLFKKADRILRLMSHGTGSTPGKNESCEHSTRTRTDNDVSISSYSSTAAMSLSRSLLSPRGSISNSLDAISSESKQIAHDRRFNSLDGSPTCFFLLTLAVLVFWGKVCAILFTSTCLVVAVPARATRRGSSNQGEDSVVDSAEYKKRIIMEGLLQRQRPGVTLLLRSSS